VTLPTTQPATLPPNATLNGVEPTKIDLVAPAARLLISHATERRDLFVGGLNHLEHHGGHGFRGNPGSVIQYQKDMGPLRRIPGGRGIGIRHHCHPGAQHALQPTRRILWATTLALADDGVLTSEIELRKPYACAPWGSFPDLNIASSHDEALASYFTTRQLPGVIKHKPSYYGEAKGLALAMEIARDAQSIEPIHIYWDNQGLLRATGDPGAQTAQLQMTRMHQAIAEMPNTVLLHWIPGHTGIPEHDHSDTLAERATGYRPGPKGTTQGRPTNPPDEDIYRRMSQHSTQTHKDTVDYRMGKPPKWQRTPPPSPRTIQEGTGTMGS
jgi:hypothetical protein